MEHVNLEDDIHASLHSEEYNHMKGNNLGARTLAEHEAKVIHGHYPDQLKKQLDYQTTYIYSVYVDVAAEWTMKLNNIGQNVGYRPNKIYFNIADKSFYK